MKLDWGNWLYGLWVAVVGGASNGVVAGVGLNLMDPKDFNTQQKRFWWLVGGLFAIGAAKDFFLYLSQHPAPVILTKSTTSMTATDAKGGVVTMEKTVEKTSPAPVIKNPDLDATKKVTPEGD